MEEILKSFTSFTISPGKHNGQKYTGIEVSRVSKPYSGALSPRKEDSGKQLGLLLSHVLSVASILMEYVFPIFQNN